MELLDEVQIRAINLANDKKLPEIPTLMFEFVGTGKDILWFESMQLIFLCCDIMVVASLPRTFNLSCTK